MNDNDKDRDKDKRLKYVEMPGIFRNRATDIDIKGKISMRTCEALAKVLAKRRPKTPEDFEQTEYLKKLIIETADHNEAVAGLLTYIHEFLQEISLDAKILCDGAEIRDRLKDQSDTILILMEETKTIRSIHNERNKRG